MDTWIWIIIGIVLVLIIIGIIAALTRGSKAKRIERERAEAEQLRMEAAERERTTRESQAAAAATDADARAAQADAQRQAAEADRQAAEAEQRRVEAERLQQEAHAKSEVAAEDQRAYDDKLREADAKDPDVRTDGDGRRVADHDDRHRDDDAGGDVRDGVRDDARRDERSAHHGGGAAAVGAGGAAAGAGALAHDRGVDEPGGVRDDGLRNDDGLRRDDGFRDDNRDGYRDGVIGGEDSYADEPGLTQDPDAGHGRLDEPGAPAGAPPVRGADESTRGWETSDSSMGGDRTMRDADVDQPGTGVASDRAPVEPAPDAAPGWESSDPSRRDVAQDGGDLPSATDPEATTQRSSHLDPEERPAPGEHAKPGFMDKVRGKVEDIRGDDRPRS